MHGRERAIDTQSVRRSQPTIPTKRNRKREKIKMERADYDNKQSIGPALKTQ